jgi:pimeloyl-ACP methyl ester carboxylesterase
MSFDDVVAEARTRHPDRSLDTIELIAWARLQTSMSAFDVLTPPNPDYVQVVSGIEVPSLLVIGGSAGVVSPKVAADLQRVNPRLQVEQIPDVCHGLHYDQPERFAVVVKSFLRSMAQ